MYEKKLLLDQEDFAIDGSDFEILNYECLEHIKMPVAV
jgi:thymidylate synthase